MKLLQCKSIFKNFNVRWEFQKKCAINYYFFNRLTALIIIYYIICNNVVYINALNIYTTIQTFEVSKIFF